MWLYRSDCYSFCFLGIEAQPAFSSRYHASLTLSLPHHDGHGPLELKNKKEKKNLPSSKQYFSNMTTNKTITNKVLGSKKHPNMFVDEMSMNYLEQI